MDKDKDLERIQLLVCLGGLVVFFSNLFQYFVYDTPTSSFYINILLVLVVSLLGLFGKTGKPLGFAFLVTGVSCILFTTDPRGISGGVVFVFFSLRIIRSNFYSAVAYFLVILAVLINHTLTSMSPQVSLKTMLAYGLIMSVDYLLYDKTDGE